MTYMSCAHACMHTLLNIIYPFLTSNGSLLCFLLELVFLRTYLRQLVLSEHMGLFDIPVLHALNIPEKINK